MPGKERIPSIGKKIERLCHIKGVKQDTLAAALGISQGLVSRIMHSDTIDPDKLAIIAKALGAGVEDIKKFDEDAAIFSTNNFNAPASFNDQSAAIMNNTNRVDKIIEMAEHQKALYEQLLASERQRIALLEEKLSNQEQK